MFHQAPRDSHFAATNNDDTLPASRPLNNETELGPAWQTLITKQMGFSAVTNDVEGPAGDRRRVRKRTAGCARGAGGVRVGHVGGDWVDAAGG
jgi:hypothetical protein